MTSLNQLSSTEMLPKLYSITGCEDKLRRCVFGETNSKPFKPKPHLLKEKLFHWNQNNDSSANYASDSNKDKDAVVYLSDHSHGLLFEQQQLQLIDIDNTHDYNENVEKTERHESFKRSGVKSGDYFKYEIRYYDRDGGRITNHEDNTTQNNVDATMTTRHLHGIESRCASSHNTVAQIDCDDSLNCSKLSAKVCPDPTTDFSRDALCQESQASIHTGVSDSAVHGSLKTSPYSGAKISSILSHRSRLVSTYGSRSCSSSSSNNRLPSPGQSSRVPRSPGQRLQAPPYGNDDDMAQSGSAGQRPQDDSGSRRSVGSGDQLQSPFSYRVKESEGDNLCLDQGGVTLTLLNSSLWKAFNRVGTEMIINRGGRRMFPYLSLSVQGLEPRALYSVCLQILPASARRCKYISSKWMPVGMADTEPTQPPSFHLDSPSPGKHWNRTKINFPKIKLSNNKDSTPHNILLHSMHKYKIVTTFTRTDQPGAEDSSQPDVRRLSFHFPETDFIAVTAYQNDCVTQMKIHNNPFAKAFRDSSYTEIRRNIASRKRKHGDMHQARLGTFLTSSVAPALTPAMTAPEDKSVLPPGLTTTPSPAPGPVYPWSFFNVAPDCCLIPPPYHSFGYPAPWLGVAGGPGSLQLFPPFLSMAGPHYSYCALSPPETDIHPALNTSETYSGLATRRPSLLGETAFPPLPLPLPAAKHSLPTLSGTQEGTEDEREEEQEEDVQ